MRECRGRWRTRARTHTHVCVCVLGEWGEGGGGDIDKSLHLGAAFAGLQTNKQTNQQALVLATESRHGRPPRPPATAAKRPAFPDTRTKEGTKQPTRACTIAHSQARGRPPTYTIELLCTSKPASTPTTVEPTPARQPKAPD